MGPNNAADIDSVPDDFDFNEFLRVFVAALQHVLKIAQRALISCWIWLTGTCFPLLKFKALEFLTNVLLPAMERAKERGFVATLNSFYSEVLVPTIFSKSSLAFSVLFLALVYVFLPFIVKKVRDHSIPTALQLHHAAESFLTMSSFSHRASSPHQTLRRAS